MCKDAILTKNDDVIDLKFWNKFSSNANKPKQSTNYDSGNHSVSVDCHLRVFSKNIFSLFLNDVIVTHPVNIKSFLWELVNIICGLVQREKSFAASLSKKNVFWTTLLISNFYLVKKFLSNTIKMFS